MPAYSPACPQHADNPPYNKAQLQPLFFLPCISRAFTVFSPLPHLSFTEPDSAGPVVFPKTTLRAFSPSYRPPSTYDSDFALDFSLPKISPISTHI